jgi:antitoxin component YwqK of YwqJK toxin-antitoxin module
MNSSSSGPTRVLYPTGEVESSVDIVDPLLEKSIQRRWYRNGQMLSEVELVSGIPNGRVRQWTENGTLILDAVKLNNVHDGLYQSWWDNGVLKEQGVFLKGERQPGYKWFKNDGSLWQEL